MKKLLYYIALMTLAVILFPLLIVKGCSTGSIAAHQENLADRAGRAGRADRAYRVDEQVVNKHETVTVMISSENKVKEMQLEEYVKGVVCAEMPAEFELEALKAQAVAARSYAYAHKLGLYIDTDSSHKSADVCTDYKHCQAWISKEEAMHNWGKDAAEAYWSKISQAVDMTRGVIITYDRQVINPLFHANSGGKTENAEEVWNGNKVPYLTSVVSRGEDASQDYRTSVYFSRKEFVSKLKKKYPNINLTESDCLKNYKILERTEGDRVKTLKLGSITIDGTDFRELFDLNSANFTISKEKDGRIEITTLGYGHGVGMSQWGANYMAKNGSEYAEIIKYYYRGVSLEKIE